MPKAMKSLRGAKVTKRPPKAMELLPGAKAKNRTPGAKAKNNFPWPKAMKRIHLEDDRYLVVYVARAGVTDQQMLDHYRKIMIPWLKKKKMTNFKCWIARHDGLLSIIIQVNVYLGDWRKIPNIQKLYRSDSKNRVLMEALAEEYID
jgi:hypothetical protein